MESKKKANVDNNKVMQKNYGYSKGAPVMNNGFDDQRDLNLVGMILNLESNDCNDFEKVFDVYDTYRSMEQLDTNNDFKESLGRSKGCVAFNGLVKQRLEELKKNNPSSFLVLPIRGRGHLWSTVIKKTDEGFNATIVNKGLRFWHDPMEEFVFKADKLDELIYSVRFASGMRNVEKVYEAFQNSADKAYNLRINAGPQKVGNCFTKNIQAGIKVAYATRNLPYEKYRALRLPGPYTPFGTKNKDRITFKWLTMTTEQMQKLFTRSITNRNPNIKDRVEKSIEIYSVNKYFREALKKGKEPTESFIKTFDPQGKTSSLSKEDRIKVLAGKLTTFTGKGFLNDIKKIIKGTKDEHFIKMFDILKTIEKLSYNMKRNTYISLFLDGNHELGKSLDALFGKKEEYKNLDPEVKAKKILNELNSYSLKSHKTKVQELLVKLYGWKDAGDEYSRLMDNASIKMQNTERNLKDIKVHLTSLEKYFPIMARDARDDLSDSYNKIAKELLYNKNQPSKAISAVNNALLFNKNDDNLLTRGIAFQVVNEPKRAISDITQAIKIDPKNYLSHFARANAYNKMNNKLAAKQDMVKAYRLNPSKDLKKILEGYKGLNLSEIRKKHHEIFK